MVLRYRKTKSSLKWSKPIVYYANQYLSSSLGDWTDYGLPEILKSSFEYTIYHPIPQKTLTNINAKQQRIVRRVDYIVRQSSFSND